MSRLRISLHNSFSVSLLVRYYLYSYLFPPKGTSKLNCPFFMILSKKLEFKDSILSYYKSPNKQLSKKLEFNYTQYGVKSPNKKLLISSKRIIIIIYFRCNPKNFLYYSYPKFTRCSTITSLSACREWPLSLRDFNTYSWEHIEFLSLHQPTTFSYLHPG